jgi:hypothetical protein
MLEAIRIETPMVVTSAPAQIRPIEIGGRNSEAVPTVIAKIPKAVKAIPESSNAFGYLFKISVIAAFPYSLREVFS